MLSKLASAALPVLLCLLPSAAAQASEDIHPSVALPQFDHGVAGADGVYAATASLDGTALVAGFIETGVPFQRLLRIVRLNAAGQLVSEWTATDPRRFTASGVVEDADGNVIVAGKLSQGSLAANNYSETAWVAKFDQDGKPLWERTTWANAAFDADHIELTESGLRLVGAANAMSGRSFGSVWIVDLDAEGNVTSERLAEFDADGKVSPFSAMADGDAHVIVGSVTSPGDWNVDAFAFKIAPDGGVVWRHRLGGSEWDDFSAVTKLPTGRIAVAGRKGSGGRGNSDGWLVVIGPDGAIEQDLTFGGAKSDRFHSVVVRPDGGLLLGGDTESKGAGDFDAWIVRIGPDGTILRDLTAGTRKWETARLLALSGGEMLVIGQSVSEKTRDWNLWGAAAGRSLE